MRNVSIGVAALSFAALSVVPGVAVGQEDSQLQEVLVRTAALSFLMSGVAMEESQPQSIIGAAALFLFTSGVAQGQGSQPQTTATSTHTNAVAALAGSHATTTAGEISVGDEDQFPTIMDQLHQRPSQTSVQSSLKLLSDPQDVDFKPYLIRILATVRRNWLAIISNLGGAPTPVCCSPESARLGWRGKVLLQFTVDRSGIVPKLVLAMPTGTEALDRAAIAAISASVPFPPLPAEFKGNEVRLQFTLVYNMK